MDRGGVSIQDLWQVLRRRKLRLLLAAVIGGVLAIAIKEALPVHYTSEALLEVESHTPISSELNPAAEITTPDQVRTEADILQSQALANSVVGALGLANAPDLAAAVQEPTWIDWISIGLQKAQTYVQGLFGPVPPPNRVAAAENLFKQRLRVEASEKSHIVSVYFQSGSPELSAQVVNTLLKTYLAGQVAAKLGVTTQEDQWLTEHLAALQRDVNDAAAKAQAFRDANHLVDIQAGALPAVQLNQQEQNLAIARQELAKAQAAYDTARSRSGSGFNGQEVLGSPLIQRLRQREAEVEQRMANLEQRDGSNSPFLQPVAAELNSIRQQIANQTGKIVSALGRDVELSQLRVTALEEMVAVSQAQARRNVAASAGLAQLNQELEAKRHVYNAFLTRMEQTQLASIKFPTSRIVSPAVAPFKPDGVSRAIVIAVGIIVGLFVAAAIFILRQLLSSRISSAKDVELLTGITPIASVPTLPGIGGLPVPLRILDMGQSGMAETLHALRFAIQEMTSHSPCSRVLVTSSTQDEGKTTLAASLARLSAASGLRVLLVEADLRHPTLSRMLRLSPKIYLEDLLSDRRALFEAIQVDPKSNLHCLTANGSLGDASDVISALQSPGFVELMAKAQASYDMVIIDGPPVLRVIDPLILAKYSDVVLFAVAFGRTPASMVMEALHRFPSDIRDNIATVLTRVPQSEAVWRGYYGGYQRKLAA
jgi:uncharacterized protein involved in exopolysaccharide biosynthesis/Mrp family chromosome partitioning ATPase